MSDAAARFWDWAVRVHADPAVGSACLELQDAHGQCVPLLLWAVWLGNEGVPVDAVAVERAVAVARAWNAEVLVPVRGVRRRMKDPVADMSDAARLRLRERIKGLELEGERELMSALVALVPTGDSFAASVRACDQQNLRAVASGWLHTVPHPVLWSLVEAINNRNTRESAQSSP